MQQDAEELYSSVVNTLSQSLKEVGLGHAREYVFMTQSCGFCGFAWNWALICTLSVHTESRPSSVVVYAFLPFNCRGSVLPCFPGRVICILYRKPEGPPSK